MQIDDSRSAHSSVDVLGCRQEIGVNDVDSLSNTKVSDLVANEAIVIALSVAGLEGCGEVQSVPLLPPPSRLGRIGQQLHSRKDFRGLWIADERLISSAGAGAGDEQELMPLGELPAQIEQAGRPRHAGGSRYPWSENEDFHPRNPAARYIPDHPRRRRRLTDHVLDLLHCSLIGAR